MNSSKGFPDFKKMELKFRYVFSKEVLNDINFEKKYLDVFQNVIAFEFIWEAFFLPDDLEVFQSHKEKIIQVFGKNVYGIKNEILKFMSYERNFEELEGICDPFDPRLDMVNLLLLEIIYRLRSGNFDAACVKKNSSYWISVSDSLGFWKMRYLLEDLLFNINDPQGQRLVMSILKRKTAKYKSFFKDVKAILEHHLNQAGLHDFNILYRQKNIYGIYQQMQAKMKNINHITDLFGFRIIVQKKKDCYRVLEVLHSLWPPYPELEKDYIKNTKKNGYQSIHTTLSCLERQLVEFQIRTEEMDYIANFGPAHHGGYKKVSRAKLKELLISSA